MTESTTATKQTIVHAGIPVGECPHQTPAFDAERVWCEGCGVTLDPEDTSRPAPAGPSVVVQEWADEVRIILDADGRPVTFDSVGDALRQAGGDPNVQADKGSLTGDVYRLLIESPGLCGHGTDCELIAHYRMERRDSTGVTVRRTCSGHRDASAAHLSRWVSGWGDVTFTLSRIDL